MDWTLLIENSYLVQFFKLLICLGYVFTAVKEISLFASLTPCTHVWFAQQGYNHGDFTE